MLRSIWTLSKETVLSYVSDNCLSRGAAIAYYTIFSLSPVLVIVIAIAGLVFGQEAASGAIVGQLRSLMGEQGAAMIQTMLRSAGSQHSGLIASAVGVVTLLITASGVFGEMQAALNAIWHASADGSPVTQVVKTRATSLGLVATLGFLLLVSLATSTALNAVGQHLDAYLPAAQLITRVANFLLSLLLIALLFGAIYKVLPDTRLTWRDVMVGALVTAALFDIGKFLISLYLGSSSVASTYGAAGALVIVLLWIYYSSQIFLLGAEFTKVYAHRRGSRSGSPRRPGGADAPAAAAAPAGKRLTALPARHTAPAWSFWSMIAGVFVLGAILTADRARR